MFVVVSAFVDVETTPDGGVIIGSFGQASLPYRAGLQAELFCCGSHRRIRVEPPLVGVALATRRVTVPFRIDWGAVMTPLDHEFAPSDRDSTLGCGLNREQSPRCHHPRAARRVVHSGRGTELVRIAPRQVPDTHSRAVVNNSWCHREFAFDDPAALACVRSSSPHIPNHCTNRAVMRQ